MEPLKKSAFGAMDKMSFEKFESTKKSSFVLDQLLEELSSDKYGVGDRLPTEDRLAQMMGVSRTSVREALAALRLTGVITSRAGQGTHLSRKIGKKNGASQKKALLVLRKNTSPGEMFEARATIEKPVADLAMEKMENSDLEDLEEILERMCRAADKQAMEKYISFNKQFHLSIAETTGNTVLKSIMKSLLSYMDEELWQEERRCYYEENPERFDRSLQIHKKIFRSFKNEDGASLATAMDAHFNFLSGKGELRNN